MKNELLQDLENRFETLKHIRNLAQSYDEKLFCYLLEQSTYKTEFKNRFFIVRNNTYIFKLNDFLTFLDLRNLSGSFTSYTNKIGLGFKTKSFLKTNNEVVLNFAYKDGVIKGGQSKDEDKKNEIFFNEILAKDEIDVLFARKALQNFELIGQGDLKENLNNANLLIKGNNLLCLHSLKKKFANKVKLIYIDPPYNTGNDSFNYNDNFNHSTWLTFMKNRLEIARDFLRDDGVIFIQCDDNEQAYLKVLCDEIFGRDNFVGCCPVVVNRGGRDYGGIAKTHDYLLIYGKTLLTELYQIEDKDKKFQFSDENGGFNLMELRNRNIRFNKENRPNLYYPFYVNPNNTDENELLEISLESKDGFIELNPLESQGINTVWRWGKEKAEKFLNTEIKGKRKQDGGFMIVQKNRLLLKRQRSIWDNREFVNERGTEHIKQMLGRDSFSYPKSEFLLQRILELTTQENDLVMDFFAGSGTTLAVAMKMKRQFIGIEQMDYIESITKERLKKVVSGEQGGISKAVDWQGGGSFIYAELMPLNAIYKERIKNINDEKMLDSIYKDLESKAFLDYRIDLDSILKDKEFKELDLQNKQEALLKILDSNMDYVLYGDIQDEDYAISSEVIELNKIFYGDCHDFANAKSRNDKKGK
ncbi:TPA: site-specific DNA-methyltransferase [Campylobacter upsaliensis]|nr:site-specific DNA-methyltransferase [Campylobacter upsaliensis]